MVVFICCASYVSLFVIYQHQWDIHVNGGGMSRVRNRKAEGEKVTTNNNI